eukprot:943290-Rhodomonas_salina.1
MSGTDVQVMPLPVCQSPVVATARADATIPPLCAGTDAPTCLQFAMPSTDLAYGATRQCTPPTSILRTPARRSLSAAILQVGLAFKKYLDLYFNALLTLPAEEQHCSAQLQVTQLCGCESARADMSVTHL